MARVSAALRKAGAAAASSAATTAAASVSPPRLLVLTMVPNGGAMTPALRLLGFHPYTLESVIRKGRSLHHPQEWQSLLRGEKPFNPVILSGRLPSADGAATTPLQQTEAAGATSTSDDAAPFDSLVGPPATLAFEAILKQCPHSTKVVLVEEPDKLTWEKDMEQWLFPLVQQCERRGSVWGLGNTLPQMLRNMHDIRRALVDSAIGKHRTRAEVSAAAATARNLPAGRQLSLAGALDLFEEHVKHTIPHNRLLVYRVTDGWAPLCQFLQLPVPVAETTSDDGSPMSAPVPFPSPTSGSDVFIFLKDGLHRASVIVWVFYLAILSLGLLVLSAFSGELVELYRRYRSHVKAAFVPHLEKAEQRQEGSGEQRGMSVREAMIIAKNASLDFEEAYRKEGGVMTSFAGVYRGIVDAPDAGTRINQ